ncbi:DUF2911 domain-containing protein [Fulvivirga sp. M361]|uniref:DUF2911 domain-containing protein n=1 Tax=Fulvivirga sp. M361 TaxID=2594266 RepID=UPI00117A9A9A|nr:DUF2911 domain-containing protein [Fulvivirga sp. M361]TRX54285.1 DUF2911 domain-containing protein [Fulvivirga sp. M361]
MKQLNILFSVALLLLISCAYGQESPPAEAKGTISGAEIKINYHQPSARGRTMIGGDKVPYGKVWRTGANNATTFEVSKDIKVEGKKLPKGKYSFFTIPGEKEWTIIFNSEPEQWGAYKYDESKDVLRVKVAAGKPADHVETFDISVEKDGVVLAWEKSLVKVGVQ